MSFLNFRKSSIVLISEVVESAGLLNLQPVHLEKAIEMVGKFNRILIKESK